MRIAEKREPRATAEVPDITVTFYKGSGPRAAGDYACARKNTTKCQGGTEKSPTIARN